ncbi:hypothetical protein C8N43_0198 [Litoreibacter ponti]|uniref:HdeA/HdeB family protein n=1 Tax=Litoreibacter ponti TaxID=1510457 RepID=A0A2T6BHM8_9RHOB|nr:hypothetical protein [Litoreibacter ponti]PTX55559.1 hypothetical protein C8N43_0198 [Litoreibacter ponti]
MRLALALALLMAVPAASFANPDRAAQMCRWLDSLDVTEGGCRVADKSVYVKIDAPKSEAAEMCSTITSTLRGDGIRFDSGWSLRIFNPKTGNAQTAICKL